ncbi:MAG: L,D-transpeptidase family protein [Clostridiales bacterium]|nr:L,D-transpeptidase family protein [Clostridiales bacterium]
MKKAIIIISAVVLLLIAALTFATFSYAKTADYKSDVLPDNITINGVDCSGLTYDKATKKLTDAWNSRCIVVVGGLDEKLASFTDFGCTYDVKKKIKNVKHNYLVFAASNHYFHTAIAAHVPMVVKDYDEEFKKEALSSKFLNDPKARECRDAYVDMSKSSFPIVKEVYGTKADSERFFQDLLAHIQTGDLNIIFEEKDYYDMPKVKADDRDLKAYQKYCKKYLKQKITYDLGESTFTLSAEQLDALMNDDRSGDADAEAVKAYVSQLANTYDNIGADRAFTSLTGRSVNVSGGSYGWEINESKETNQLIADINSHKDVTREPVFSDKGYGKYSKDLGNTYIDVDISNQAVNFFKNGELIFSSPCVSGCVTAGHSTYTGTFYVANKVRDVVLRGDNGDGTQYASPVKYWVGIWGGQGFHDADWRGAFGGGIYYSGGSHGCVNMPPSRMPALYSEADIGIPVVMHY